MKILKELEYSMIRVFLSTKSLEKELLYPLKSLSSVKDIGQVFLDIACGTCVPSGSWLPSAHHG